MNRKLISAAVAGSAVVTLSACGSSTDVKPTAKTTPSPSATPHARSSSMVARGGVVDGQMFATMVVDAMGASKTAHITQTNTSHGGTISEGDYEFGNPVKSDLKMGSAEMEIVHIDGVFYIKGLEGLPKPWLKVDLRGTDPYSRWMSSVGYTSKNSDPRSFISMAKGVKGRDLGVAEVWGVSTRIFAFEIPLSAFAKLLSPEKLKEAGGTIKDPIAVQYWVGDDNLPRKVTIAAPARSIAGQVATYSDWGEPVNIVAPPAAQVGLPPGR